MMSIGTSNTFLQKKNYDDDRKNELKKFLINLR